MHQSRNETVCRQSASEQRSGDRFPAEQKRGQCSCIRPLSIYSQIRNRIFLSSSSCNTRDFNHEIRAQSEIRLHREYSPAMKIQNAEAFMKIRDSSYIRLDHTVCSVFSPVDHARLVCLRVHEHIKCMSQKLHLHTCILRIHRLDLELLRADDRKVILE